MNTLNPKLSKITVNIYHFILQLSTPAVETQNLFSFYEDDLIWKRSGVWCAKKSGIQRAMRDHIASSYRINKKLR